MAREEEFGRVAHVEADTGLALGSTTYVYLFNVSVFKYKCWQCIVVKKK